MSIARSSPTSRCATTPRSVHSWSRRARHSTLPDARADLGPRNAAVRRLRALLRDPRARDSERAFVIEGPRAVGAALDRGASLDTVYFSTNAHVAFASLTQRVEAAGIPIEHLKEGVLEKLGSTVTPQPVLAV